MGKAGRWITIACVVAYLGFELTHVRRFAYRMEPGFVLEELVLARRAAHHCGEHSVATAARFTKNFAVLYRRALADQGARDLGRVQEQGQAPVILPESSVRERLDQHIAEAEARVDARVEALGCADRDLWRWNKLFEVRSRLNLVDARTDAGH